jgi:hypothetical protein
MPFTVVTKENLLNTVAYWDRSLNGSSGALVGCHCNRIGYTGGKTYKVRNKGIYWLSRLFEHFGIKYCLGGHKHTYACTWPLREYYYYEDSGQPKNSLTNGPMLMPETFSSGDPVYFLVKPNSNTGILEPVIATEGSETASDLSMINLTKFPIAAGKNFSGDTIKGYYEPSSGTDITCVTKDIRSGSNYVIYFMLQATGFKLKSNKELPGPLQKFSQVIPKTTFKATGATPSTSQIYPMFARIDLNSSNYNSGLDIKLMAIENIVPNDTTLVLNQQTAWDIKSYTGKTAILPPVLKYFDNSDTDTDYTGTPYGASGGSACWSDTDHSLNLHI